jgi:signal transduction histidine kinase
VSSAGEAVERVQHLGRRYAIGIRAVTIIPIGTVAVLADASGGGWAAITIAALAGWSIVYVAALGVGRPRWVTVGDAAVVCCLGVVALHLTPVAWLVTGKSWVRPFTTFAAVGYQYSTGWRIGVPAGVAACTAVAVSSSIAQPGPIGIDAVVTAVWSNVIPMLGRLLFTLITRAAARADGMRAAAEAARLELIVADSVRADERAIADSLHDTAATTLLMVALRQAEGLNDLVRLRARHDLAVLKTMRTFVRPERVELCVELRSSAARCAVETEVAGPVVLNVPPPVARALVDATGEALTNVVRHAETSSARLHFGEAAGIVFVEVSDAGCGFELAKIPMTRRGLRTSIVARVAAVGGTAEVTSALGQGTRVRLTWAR